MSRQSSRNSVPRDLLELAMACGRAPVKAPLSWPNKLDFPGNASGMAALISARNGALAARS